MFDAIPPGALYLGVGAAFFVLWQMAQRKRVKVLVVIDGDTFETMDKRGRKYRIRLKGCDCPEMGQARGAEIRDEVKLLMGGKWVRARFMGRDKYRRHLARIRLPDGRDLTRVLLREGLAYPMPGDFSLGALAARVSRKGVWGGWRAPKPWQALSRRKGLVGMASRLFRKRRR